MITSLLCTLRSWFRPALDALFTLHMPWQYRWRLLALQPISLLTYSISSWRYWFRRRPFHVERLTVAPGVTLRVLVFRAPHPTSEVAGRTTLRPLHLDIHGGAFVGGLPEADGPWCERVAATTGAVVVSATYRYAPRHPFPAAIDDIDALVRFLRGAEGRARFGVDPHLPMTVSGFSAGGNLALATALAVPEGVKAAVCFCAAIDLRLRPEEKPFGVTDAKPGFDAEKETTKIAERAAKPPPDPLRFLLPLFDSYPGPARAQNLVNPRMSPVLGDIAKLPENILMVIPEVDILVHEQTTLIERLKHEAAHDARYAGRRYESLYDEKGFHGWLELPNFITPQAKKDEIYGAGTDFIKDTHRRHGWVWP